MTDGKYRCPTCGVTEHVINFHLEAEDDRPEMDKTYCLYCILDVMQYHLPSLEKVDDE